MRRNIYRNFGSFYKDIFAKYTKKYLNLRGNKELKSEKMTEFIYKFIDEHFGIYYSKLSTEEQTQFEVSLKQVLFSHRHNKGDLFCEGIDFKRLRDVMYNYSQQARDEFFSDIHRCHIFSYYLFNQKSKYLKQVSKDSSKLVVLEYEKEFQDIEDILKTRIINT
jgi:hypothetical protein